MSEINNWINQVHQGDCLKKLQQIPENSVDLIIADPPYNLSSGSEMNYDGGGSGDFGGDWNQVNEDWDGFTIENYEIFTNKWISQCKKILKNSGSIIIFGTYHNIGFVNISLQDNKLEILNEIIWYKRNAFPNLSQARLTASHENILWAYKGQDKDYTFNYDWIKETKWSSDSFDKSNTQVRTVWNIPNNKSKEEKNCDHPTQKPLSVIDRLVQMASNQGDIILDPFAGSGTSLVSAKKHGRDYIGIEKEKGFVDLSKNRLESVKRVNKNNDDSVFNY